VAPSINEQYYTDNLGHRRLTPVALRFKTEVKKILGELARQGRLDESFVAGARTGYLAIYIECLFATPFQRDLDGVIKITIDAVCQGLGEDINDNRVVDLHLSKRIRPNDPYMYLEIDLVDEWEFDEQAYVVLPDAQVQASSA
jgi:crossover junction endodeoxyribonuclease RusA